jgi:hypothetical protein
MECEAPVHCGHRMSEAQRLAGGGLSGYDS